LGLIQLIELNKERQDYITAVHWDKRPTFAFSKTSKLHLFERNKTRCLQSFRCCPRRQPLKSLRLTCRASRSH